MSDHIAAVRAQAEKEAERRLDAFRKHVGFAPEDAAWWQMGFIEGQVALASRLAREKIAGAITHRPTGQSAADAVLALFERGDDE